MSISELERFVDFLRTDETVREQAEALDDAPEELVKLAEKHGFTLERADLEVMTDDELEGVTGGFAMFPVHGDGTVGGF